MGPNSIDVICILFPDGSQYFLHPRDETQDDVRRVLEAWKEEIGPDRRQRYEEANTMGGFVWLHMLVEDLEALPVTDMQLRIASRMGGAA